MGDVKSIELSKQDVLQHSPDSSNQIDIEHIPSQVHTESLENSNKAQVSTSEPLDKPIESQNTREETIEEIERLVPAHQKHKKIMISQIKNKSMPQTVKIQKIKEIVDSPDLSEEEQKIKMKEFFHQLGPPFNINIRRKRHREESLSRSSLSQSLDKQNRPPLISPDRPRTQTSPELTPQPTRTKRRNENSNREYVQLPDSPIHSESSAGSSPSHRGRNSSVELEHVVPETPPSPETRNQRQMRRSSSRNSENEGNSHSNMAAPSRPHIPYTQPTVKVTNKKQQDSIRPPKQTLGA